MNLGVDISLWQYLALVYQQKSLAVEETYAT